MLGFDFAKFGIISALVSAVISLASLACMLYFKRSKTYYNHEAQRVELDILRSSFEEKIHDLAQRMQKNPARWREVNHLILEGSTAGLSSLGESDTKQVLSLNPYRFIEELGIDLNALALKENQVFVLTPFHPMYEETYETIKKSCSMNALEAVRGDEAFKVGNILKHVIEQIIVSPYIVANINGRNPNVHYELGIAHCLGKNILLVSEGIDDVAFNLQSERVLIYRNQEDLSNKVYIYYTKLLKGK
jgi:hypothetical protein